MTKLVSTKKVTSLGMDAAKIGVGTLVGTVLAGPVGGAVGGVIGAQMAEDDFTKKLVTALAVIGFAGYVGGTLSGIIGGNDGGA